MSKIKTTRREIKWKCRTSLSFKPKRRIICFTEWERFNQQLSNTYYDFIIQSTTDLVWIENKMPSKYLFESLQYLFSKKKKQIKSSSRVENCCIFNRSVEMASKKITFKKCCTWGIMLSIKVNQFLQANLVKFICFWFQ